MLEDLYKEFLKCISKSNLEQKNSWTPSELEQSNFFKVGDYKELLPFNHFAGTVLFNPYNTLMIISYYLRPYLEEKAKTCEFRWLLKVTWLMNGKLGFGVLWPGSRTGNLTFLPSNACCGVKISDIRVFQNATETAMTERLEFG